MILNVLETIHLSVWPEAGFHILLAIFLLDVEPKPFNPEFDHKMPRHCMTRHDGVLNRDFNGHIIVRNV